MTAFVAFECPDHGPVLETVPTARVWCRCRKRARPTADAEAELRRERDRQRKVRDRAHA